MYFVGCSGWFYRHWLKLFYPEELPQSRWFQHYTKYFNTVELNSPFYHWPKETTVRSWYRQAPEHFVYTLKVSRMITHTKKFKETSRLVQDFYKLGNELREKMGCFLFQLPPSLRFSEKKLDEIQRQLDPDKKNAVEFRHVSWFTRGVYDSLRRNNVIFCIVSAPDLPEDFVKTADDIYIRFHGKGSWYASNYSDNELRRWSSETKRAKARNVWAYFNNDANAYAVANSLYLKKLLSKQLM
jgi:uncharacterized protein YecE (DUF72 family)